MLTDSYCTADAKASRLFEVFYVGSFEGDRAKAQPQVIWTLGPNVGSSVCDPKSLAPVCVRTKKKPQISPLPSPGFPVEFGGVGNPHGPFSTERRIRGGRGFCVAGNPGTPCRKTFPRKVRGTADPFTAALLMTQGEGTIGLVPRLRRSDPLRDRFPSPSRLG